MTDAFKLDLTFLLLLAMLHVLTTVYGQTTRNPVVEGFQGGSVILPCTLSGTGTLEWKTGPYLIMVKTPEGSVVISDGPFQNEVELSGQSNLFIQSLDKARDNNKDFICRYDSGSASQATPVRVLKKISEAAIQESVEDTVSVTSGLSKTLTCTVTGDPNPAPSYSWRVDRGPVSGQEQTFSLTANRSMTTIKCTATNKYSNGTKLSRKEATATLNVQYLDTPVVNSPGKVIEGQSATLQCLAEGNPGPAYEWRKSGSTVVISTSGLYSLGTVDRSAAGEYTCTSSNLVGAYDGTVNLVVQYPPDVTVSYDETTQTLTCTAEGVPATYSFSPWEHRLGGKLLQTLGSASSPLILDSVLTYEDMGSYVCTVSNQIKDAQSGYDVVRPKTAAIFQAEPQSIKLGIGKTEEISAPFYTGSEIVKVEWQKYGQSSALTSHREEAGPVSLTVRGESVTIEGNVTILMLTDVTQEDEGNYTVTVAVSVNGETVERERVIFVSVEAVAEPKSGAQEENQGSFPVAAVASGVVGVLVVIVLIVGLIIFLRRRSTNSGGSDREEEKASVKETGGSHEHLVRGTEQKAFTDSRWQDPDAEIAVNDLYQSASFSRELPPQDQRPAKPERTFTHRPKPDYVPRPGAKGRSKDQDMEMAAKPLPSERHLQNGAGRNRDTIEYEPTNYPSSRSWNNNQSPRKPGLTSQQDADGARKDVVNPPKSPTPATDLDFVRRNRAY